jgi:hypothetical protein
VLIDRVTNYKAYLSYIKCLFVILKQQTAPPNRSDRDYLADARQTLLDLAEQFGSRERAPVLALLEINRRLQSPDEAPRQDRDALSDSKTETIPLLKRYWTLFGDKGCVMDDLKVYWPTETDSSSDAFNDLRAFLTEQIQGDKASFTAPSQRRLLMVIFRLVVHTAGIRLSAQRTQAAALLE